MPEYPLLVFNIYYNAQKYALSYAPMGWDSSLFKEQLDNKYYTIRRSFSEELKFVFEAYDLLTKILYFDGPDALAQLEILKLEYKSQTYKRIYLGKFDFENNPIDDKLIKTFTVNLTQEGISNDLDAYQDVVFSIPVEENNPISVNLGALSVTGNAILIGDPYIAEGNPYGLQYYPALTAYSDSTTDDVVELFDTTFSQFQRPEAIFLKSHQNALAIRVWGSITIKPNRPINDPGIGWRGFVVVYLRNGIANTNLTLGKIPIVLSSPSDFDNELSLDYDQSTIVNDLDELYFFAEFQNVYESQHFDIPFNIYNSSVNISYTTSTVDYFTRGIRIFDLFKSLTQKLNDSILYLAISDLLSNTEWKNLVVFVGDSIRGISNTQIKTSFSDFFKSIDAILCVGLGISDNNLVLEKRSFFFNKFIKIADIGEVSSMQIEVATDYLYSLLKVGYQDNTYEIELGKEEVNTEQSWSSSSSISQTNKEITSIYRTDPKGIDQLITDFRNQETATVDTNSDNDVWLVKIKESPEEDGTYRYEGTEIYQSVRGITPGKIFNLKLDPRSMLVRYSSVLSVPFAIKKSGQINFQSSKKNSALSVTNFDNVTINETDPLPYDKMEAPLFVPFYATITSSLSDEKYDTMISNLSLNGYVQWTFKNKTYKGFLVENEFDIVRKSTKQLKFLLTTDNDLLK